MKRYNSARFALVVGLIAAFLFPAVSTDAITYTGKLSSNPSDPTSNGLLISTDAWEPVTLSWVVTLVEAGPYAGSYSYTYTWTGVGKEVSHLIFETSDPLSVGDIFNVSGDSNDYDIDGTTYYPDPHNTGDNPDMPNSMYGVKFNLGTEESITISFNSWRTPVWGDVYAKDGRAGGEIQTAWNAGFTGGDANDPLVAPHSGSEQNHILRPNGYVPEPGTFIGLSLPVLGALGFMRRRRA